MNIALSHLSLNFLGGEEKLCLSFIEALKASNHHVTLFTVEKTNWESVKRVFGKVTLPDEEIFTTPLPIHDNFSKVFTLMFSYTNYLAGLIKLTSRRKYNAVVNTYGDLFNSIADITYVHFPIRATLDYCQIPAFASPFKWKIYSKVYDLSSLFTDSIKPSILLTNSKFTQQVIKKYLNKDSLLLHPPVAVQNYISKNVKRKNYIITISKFTPKRCLHKIPLIACRTRNVKFIVIGVADKYSLETIQNLRKTISMHHVEDRVILSPNVSRSTLINYLTEAKAYLHVMPFEHFGISVVEAMAAGCVPIVHRSGGPWLDILNQQQGESGFSYITIEEAAQIIDLIMSNESLRRDVSFNAQRRALLYDTSVFQRKLNKIIKKFDKQDVSNYGSL
jgi:glycosyltransferase involved in cell wall biosynthesis